VVHCPRCQALLRGHHWIDGQDLEAALSAYLEGQITRDPRARGVKIRTEIIPQDPYSRKADVSVEGHIEEVPLTAKLSCRLELRRQVCPPCSRAAGGYYEAILQVRGLERLSTSRLESIAARLEGRLNHAKEQDRNFFAARTERVKGGLDYYLSTIGGARNLARGLLAAYGGTSGESARLVGRKEGRNLYRVTLVVRLPPFDRGDFLLHDRKPARVFRIDGSRVILTPLSYGESVEVILPLEKVNAGQRLGGPELILPAQVISREGNEALLLDPETHRTQEVILPPELTEGELTEVMVLRHDGRLYPLPPGP